MNYLCKRCVWRTQCGGEHPCSHYDPINLEDHVLQEYIDELRICKRLADTTAIEQDNLEWE